MLRSTILLLAVHVLSKSVSPDSSGAQVSPLDTSDLNSTKDQYKAVTDASQDLLQTSESTLGGLKPGKGDTLINFLPDTDAATRKAIMDSVSVAQVVCERKVKAGQLPSKESDPVAYYAAYNKVMEGLGWNMKNEFFADYHSMGAAVSVAQMMVDGIISVVSGIAGGGGATVAAAAINALQVMIGMAKKDGSDGSDKSWDFFKISYMSADARSFTVGAGHEDEYGIPQLTTFTNRFQYTGSHGTVLFFFSWDSRDTKFDYRFSSMYLNQDVYARRTSLMDYLLDNIDSSTFAISNDQAKEFMKGSGTVSPTGKYDFKLSGLPYPGHEVRWTNNVVPGKPGVVPQEDQKPVQTPEEPQKPSETRETPAKPADGVETPARPAETPGEDGRVSKA